MATSTNRKTSTKPTPKSAMTAAGALPGYTIPDEQLRITALETAARVVSASTSSPALILDAANQFYAFLTGAK